MFKNLIDFSVKTANTAMGVGAAKLNASRHRVVSKTKPARKGKPSREMLALEIMRIIETKGWTRSERNHFFAQVTHESGYLNYTEELASGAAYEGRADLGNTVPGYGRKYKGYGIIQITGYYNIKGFAERVGRPDIIDDPSIIAVDPYLAVMSAFDWWERKKQMSSSFKRAVLTDDVEAVSAGVNGRNRKTGKPNHLRERQALYDEYKAGRGLIRALAGKAKLKQR